MGAEPLHLILSLRYYHISIFYFKETLENSIIRWATAIAQCKGWSKTWVCSDIINIIKYSPLFRSLSQNKKYFYLE